MLSFIMEYRMIGDLNMSSWNKMGLAVILVWIWIMQVSILFNFVKLFPSKTNFLFLLGTISVSIGAYLLVSEHKKEV